jgi:hypothetical protein
MTRRSTLALWHPDTMTLRLTLSLLLALVLCPAAAEAGQAAATAEPPAKAALPAAREILDRHVAAIGGRDAILAHTSSRAEGTFSVPSAGLTGSVTVFAAVPNRSLMRVSIPGVGEQEEGYNGTIGWSLSPLTGPSLLQGRQLEEREFDAYFRAELREPGRYREITTVERTEFDGRTCYKLRLTRKTGGEDIEFYEVGTGLRAGSITTRETPMGAVTVTTTEQDYRRFGRLLHPTKVTQSLMGLQQVITLETVEFDTVDAAVFEPPVQIRALVK